MSQHSAYRARHSGRIHTYPAAVACRLAEYYRLATRADDLAAIGEELRSTLWAACRPEDATRQCQRAHALDKAFPLILIRLPADAVVERTAGTCGECDQLVATKEFCSYSSRAKVAYRGGLTVFPSKLFERKAFERQLGALLP